MWVPLKQKLRRAREMLPEGIENGVRKRGGWKAEYCKNVIHGMVLGLAWSYWVLYVTLQNLS